MDKILHGWYTFISGSGINFMPYSSVYNQALFNNINSCNICYNLSKKEIVDKCKIFCFDCKKIYK